jgi:hypothetical protein
MRINVRPISGVAESRTLIESIGLSPADFFLADKVLWVDGPTDIPVFEAWLSKAPFYNNANIAVLSLGGDDAANDDFDATRLSTLHPKMWAILDSERAREGQEPKGSKLKIQKKLCGAGIKCYLTERPATENYFTGRALKQVYATCPDNIDPDGPPDLTKQGLKQFTKRRNGAVALAMEWTEIQGTDIGQQIEVVLRA